MRSVVSISIFILVGGLIAGGLVHESDIRAQSKEPPTLTDVQKLTVQNLVQAVELDQLRVQAAAASFEKHRDDLNKLLSSLQVPGYSFDLQTQTYTAKPESPKPEK